MGLQPHQQVTVDWFLRSPNRGLFIIHGAGSGKTRTAVTIAKRMTKFRRVILVAPKSLHANFENELHNNRAKGERSDGSERYAFVSSNASNMIDQLEKAASDSRLEAPTQAMQLNDKLIIVDEAHILLVGMSNGSENALALYSKLMRARNCRILLMTASPIVNTVFEAVLALNICKGYMRTPSGERVPLLPETQKAFARMFMDETSGKLKNADKLRARMAGLVSYHGDLFEREVRSILATLGAKISREHYPDRLPVKLVSVPMSTPQFVAYSLARDREKAEGKDGTVGGGFSYRTKSRQLSNVYRTTADAGDDAVLDDIETNAPKLKVIGDRLKPGKKAIIYSDFVQSGITPMCGHLERLGYTRFDPHAVADASTAATAGVHGQYGVFTGDVAPADRERTLVEFNKAHSALTVLLISSSGAEGLSTIGTRQIHIMEPYWNMERIIQVMARGVRYRSHEALPEKERNVQVFIYLATAPPTEDGDKSGKQQQAPTTDIHLFTESVRKHEANTELVRAMASAAVDCTRFNDESLNFECFRCVPRKGAPLFLSNLHDDLKYPLPCSSGSDAPIDAQEIDIDGNKYVVSADRRVFVSTAEQEYVEVDDADAKEWVLRHAGVVDVKA